MIKIKNIINGMISHSRLRQKIPSFHDWKKAQKVLQQKQKAAAWVPRSVKDENGIFSGTAPEKKAMRKPGEAAIVSIDIFNLQTTFKPHCIRNNYSTRNSCLFTEQQSQKEWKSSSKKLKQYPSSKQKQWKHCFKSAQKTNANRSSIDLSWSDENALNASRTSNSRTQFTEERKLFQAKKRVSHLFNFSSIQL